MPYRLVEKGKWRSCWMHGFDKFGVDDIPLFDGDRVCNNVRQWASWWGRRSFCNDWSWTGNWCDWIIGRNATHRTWDALEISLVPTHVDWSCRNCGVALLALCTLCAEILWRTLVKVSPYIILKSSHCQYGSYYCQSIGDVRAGLLIFN